MDTTRAGDGDEETPDRGMRLTSTTWEALLRAEVSLMRTYEASGDFHPLSKTEYDVLFILASAPDHSLRMRDLNEQVLMAQPSLSRMADRLGRKGFLRRTPAINDARGTNLVLTEAGLAMQREIGRRHVRTIHSTMSVLDDDELLELRRLLRKVRVESPVAMPRTPRYR
ncbi:MarR family winged helix-turn-helix transcriptional regulator [Georgenia sp. Z1344]|uniref:MarR family winged helix-turn-helix transcriptional regulator n=1 Tax=Georgenia sp. Z1344 TaxID=3416706 RepID=UPI003CF49B81